MIVPYQCGCEGPSAPSRSSGGPHATILAMTEPDRLISSSMVNTPAGLTAAGNPAQDHVPGSGPDPPPPVTPAVGAGQVWGQRRGQRRQEGAHQPGVRDVDRPGLRVGAGVVDDQLVAAFAHGQVVSVEAGVAGG